MRDNTNNLNSDCNDLDGCGGIQHPQNLWCQTEDCDNDPDDDINNPYLL